MAQSKTVATPLLPQRSYHSLALSHHNSVHYGLHDCVIQPCWKFLKRMKMFFNQMYDDNINFNNDSCIDEDNLLILWVWINLTRYLPHDMTLKFHDTTECTVGSAGILCQLNTIQQIRNRNKGTCVCTYVSVYVFVWIRLRLCVSKAARHVQEYDIPSRLICLVLFQKCTIIILTMAIRPEFIRKPSLTASGSNKPLHVVFIGHVYDALIHVIAICSQILALVGFLLIIR